MCAPPSSVRPERAVGARFADASAMGATLRPLFGLVMNSRQPEVPCPEGGKISCKEHPWIAVFTYNSLRFLLQCRTRSKLGKWGASLHSVSRSREGGAG